MLDRAKTFIKMCFYRSEFYLGISVTEVRSMEACIYSKAEAWVRHIILNIFADNFVTENVFFLYAFDTEYFSRYSEIIVTSIVYSLLFTDSTFFVKIRVTVFSILFVVLADVTVHVFGWDKWTKRVVSTCKVRRTADSVWKDHCERT